MPEASSVLSIAGFSDPVSSLSHLAGAAVFAVLAVVLLHRARGDTGRMVALSVFAFSCVLLLSFSGVYHLLAPGTDERALLKRLDHAAIFVLIAGSFTPVHVILFRGAWRWGMLTIVWGAAVAGLVLKTVFFSTVPESLGLSRRNRGAISMALWHRWGRRRQKKAEGVAFGLSSRIRAQKGCRVITSNGFAFTGVVNGCGFEQLEDAPDDRRP